MNALIRAVWKPLPIIMGLLLLLTYLLLQSRNPDLTWRAHLHEVLTAFELHDAELDRDVLRSRAGLLPYYDSIAKASQDLRQALASLREGSRTASASTAKIIGPYADAITSAFQEKATLVEYFKSDNALLRNSLMYVIYAGQTLQAKAMDAVDQTVIGEVGRLANAMLGFTQTSDDALGKKIETILKRLPDIPQFQPDLQTLATHGRLIVQVLPRVDSQLRQITTAPTTVLTRALQDAILRHYSQLDARAQMFRFLLYGVAVILLGYLGYLLARLQLNARVLVRVNTALRTSEERLRAITEAAKEAIVSVDGAGKIASWNAGANTIFGYEATESLGMPFSRLIPKRSPETRTQAFKEWSTTGRSSFIGSTVEFTGLRKDGTEFPLEISLSTWSTAQGAYLMGIIRDLTERKRLEEKTRQQELQLIQANKMTALGTLVSSVAHEINNPNQLVLMNARMLADAWSDATLILDEYAQAHGDFPMGGLTYHEMRETIPTLAADMRDGALRIERIINDLKDFARPRTRETHRAFQLNAAVQRALRLLTHLISKRTSHFQVSLANDLPNVHGDPQHIEQVVVNLVVNALEALANPDHGVTVSSRFGEDGHGVILTVQDEGVGIPPEHLARLCDPFFTTKGDHGGTGLGLAIASELVRAHGGHLRFASTPGQGTLATVTLPCVTDEQLSPPVLTAG